MPSNRIRLPAARAGADNANWRLLTSAPILLNLLFFMLLAMMSAAIYNYSVVALGALYGTPVSTANVALSCFLLLSAGGVLIGGLVAGRTTRHGMVATLAAGGHRADRRRSSPMSISARCC